MFVDEPQGGALSRSFLEALAQARLSLPPIARRLRATRRSSLRGDQSPVCVLGSGRSGTSLTAGVLNLLGVDFGSEDGLIAGNRHNQKGYWERHEIADINDYVLAMMGGDYASPPLLPRGWARSPELRRLEERARRLVDACFGALPLWGIKDPRLSLTLPFWQRVIPGMRYVICIRNPAEVTASFARFTDEGALGGRSWPEVWSWSDLWFHVTASAFLNTRGRPRTVVFYDAYFNDLRGQVQRLAAFLGRPVTSADLERVMEFLDDRLRHHWLETDQFVSDESELVEARSLYSALQAVGSEGSLAELDRVDRLVAELSVRRERAARGPRAVQARPLPPEAPSSVSEFPAGLYRLRHFGIWKDGWLEREAFAALQSPEASALVLRAQVPPAQGQRLSLAVDGKTVASEPVEPGALELRIPIPQAGGVRRIEISWAATFRLAPPDHRRAAVLLEHLGLCAA